MSDAPGSGGEQPQTPRSKGPSAGRSYVVTLLGSAGMLACNLATGIISARLLAPEGRGVVGAITVWATLVSFISGLGFREGMSYLESRDERRAPTVLAISSASVFVLGGLGILVAELLIPIGFGAQSDETIMYARVFMLWVIPFVAYNAFGSLLGARHHFVAVTVMRVGQPFLYAVGLGVLWAAGEVSIVSVLSAQVLSYVVTAGASFVLLIRESGYGRIDRSLIRSGASYGLRAFGSTLGMLTNSRLDQMVLPAVVAAADIGLYVVAVSAASMIVGLFGSLNLVVFPMAARAGGDTGIAMAKRAIRLVFVMSAVAALGLGLLADVLVEMLYGEEFAGSVRPLRLLLPGTAFWAASSIVVSGLKAVGRPTPASAAQFVGVAVTAAGLALTLPTMGIEGAAITSSVSYSIVFVIGIWQLARVAGTRVIDLLSPAAMVEDWRWLASRLRSARSTSAVPSET